MYLKRCFPSQALEHYGSDAPQVGPGIVVLGHDDLRSLVTTKNKIRMIKLI